MISKKLRSARDELGLTRVAVARLLNVTPHAVYTHEAGISKPSMPLVRLYAKIYRIPESELMSGRTYRKIPRGPRHAA